MPIDKENKPSTYVNFTKEDVDYYLYVFGKEAKAENQCTLHSSKCAQLVAMLKSLKKNGFNKEMQKVKSELSYSVSIHYEIHEKESKYEKLVEKIENREFSLTYTKFLNEANNEDEQLKANNIENLSRNFNNYVQNNEETKAL